MYSIGVCFLKNLSVGYPRTWNFSPKSLSWVASTLPSLMEESSAARTLAALAYSGARALQCPHHGASGQNTNKISILSFKYKQFKKPVNFNKNQIMYKNLNLNYWGTGTLCFKNNKKNSKILFNISIEKSGLVCKLE